VGANRLVINGHSPIDKNTVHVRFSDGEVDMNQLIEFTFLPGSQFDFASFKLTKK